MNDSSPNWLHWRSFLAALETGSLSGAAAQLGLSQPTVGRHIDDLERAIGQTLFTRSQKGLQANALALSLLGPADAMRDAAHALERGSAKAVGFDGRRVRITASEVVGIELLPPVLARTRTALGAFHIELALSDRQEDLLTRSADIAIRMVEPQQDRLLRARLGAAKLSLFAHRDYIAQRGAPSSIAELKTHCLIGVDRDVARLSAPEVVAAGVTTASFGFRCDSDVGQLAAIRAGIGIGIAQNVIAARHADLVPVLATHFSMQLPVWMAMHEDLKRDRHLHAIFQFLTTELRSLYG
jgi:DNA-binding transcriptional LysR family regulator